MCQLYTSISCFEEHIFWYSTNHVLSTENMCLTNQGADNVEHPSQVFIDGNGTTHGYLGLL